MNGENSNKERLPEWTRRSISLLDSVKHTKEVFRVNNVKLKADIGHLLKIIDFNSVGKNTLHLESHDDLDNLARIKKEFAQCQQNTSEG